MRKSTALLVFVFVISLFYAGPLMAGDINDKIDKLADKGRNIGDQIAETAKDLEEILHNGKTIVDEINKIGDIVDPKMNPYYVDLKLREINMALEHYRLAKKRYEDTHWIRVFAKRNRKKEMEQALDEYMSRVLNLSQAKYEFNYDVYKNTTGFMSWRLPARKEKYLASLREYSQLQLDWAAYKVKKARREYEETSVIFFLTRMERKKALERAKDEYEQTLAFVETMWIDAGIYDTPGLFDFDVFPSEADKIQRAGTADM